MTPISLTLNYVSQIDRPFTWAELLETTGQSAKQARTEFNRLLDEGRLVEVKGASVMHYRYRVLQPGRALDMAKRDRMVLDTIRLNPGLLARQIGALPGIDLPMRTTMRSINRLLADGKVERHRSKYWIAGAHIAAAAGYYDKTAQRLAQARTIIRTTGTIGVNELARRMEVSKWVVYRVLVSLEDEGAIVRTFDGRVQWRQA